MMRLSPRFISKLVIDRQWDIVKQGSSHQSFNKSCPIRGEANYAEAPFTQISFLGNIILFGFLFIHNRNTITLNDITWEFLGGKENLGIIRDHSKIIIGPANIQLWGKYPYLAGDCVFAGETVKYFIYDMKGKKIIYSDHFSELENKYNLPFSKKDFVTFQDLKGQWANPRKYNQLKNNLQQEHQDVSRRNRTR